MKVCSKCRSKKDIVLHHIDGDHHNNNAENKLYLCRGCHSRHHTKQHRHRYSRDTSHILYLSQSNRLFDSLREHMKIPNMNNRDKQIMFMFYVMRISATDIARKLSISRTRMYQLRDKARHVLKVINPKGATFPSRF